jgi:hypothetical protein
LNESISQIADELKINTNDILEYIEEVKKDSTLQDKMARSYDLGITKPFTFPYMSPALGISKFFDTSTNEINNLNLGKDSINKELNLIHGTNLGTDLGYNIKYLSETLVEEIFTRAKKNRQFAFGLGMGIGLDFSHIDKNLHKRAIELSHINNDFAFGLGLSSFSDYFSLSDTMVEEILTHAKKNRQFAFGLGMSIFQRFLSLEATQKDQVIRTAKSNPEFAFGGGLSIGLMYLNLGEEYRSKIINEFTNNPRFSSGLGYGAGLIFKYLPLNEKKKVVDTANKDGPFDKGLGMGIGQLFSLLTPDIQELVIERTKERSEFCLGLGMGIGQLFSLLTPDIKDLLLRIETRYHHLIAVGLGITLGYNENSKTIDYSQFKNIVSDFEEASVHSGFSIGNGLNFPYRSDCGLECLNVWERLFPFPQISHSFSHGMGIGLTFTYLSKDIQNFFLSFQSKYVSYQNKDFLYGLGIGMGQNFPYFNPDLQESLMNIVNNARKDETFFWNNDLGPFFHFLPSDLQSKIIEEIGGDYKDIQWEEVLSNLPKDLQSKIMDELHHYLEYSHFQDVFNIMFVPRIGILFDYLPSDLQSKIIEEIGGDYKDIQWEEVYSHLPQEVQGSISKTFLRSDKKLAPILNIFYRLLEESPADLKRTMDGFYRTYHGGVVNAEIFYLSILFYYLPTDLKEKVSNYVNNALKGLHKLREISLGRIIQYLPTDVNVEYWGLSEILRYRNDIASLFSRGFMLGLGLIYRHLHEDLQKSLLKKSFDNWIDCELLIGLGQEFAYLHEDLQKSLLKKADNDKTFYDFLYGGLKYDFNLHGYD